MAAPATVDELLDLVRKSGVADEKRFEPYIEKLRASGGLPTEPAKLISVLLRDAFLTNFQAEQLMQGKYRRFHIGKYKVLERLGSGGMASVFLCEHKLMRRRVAVKVLTTAKAQDPSYFERFQREARLIGSLNHPNIVHAYDIDQDEALHYLVMEFVDGPSFQEIVKRTGPLDVPRACHYIRYAALALQHAHEKGLVHRDIKPGNILVDRIGLVKVLDMGLARLLLDEDDMLTKKYDETVLGTADYLSPEQAQDSHDVDIRTDIYSLGATFYFLLTGQTFFGEGTVAQKLLWHQTRQPRPLSQFRSDIPPAIVNIVMKMSAKSPADRFQEPGEIAAALASYCTAVVAPPSESEMPKLSLAAAGGRKEASQEASFKSAFNSAAGASSRKLTSAPARGPNGAPIPGALPSRPTLPRPVRPAAAPESKVNPNVAASEAAKIKMSTLNLTKRSIWITLTVIAVGLVIGYLLWHLLLS